MPQAFLDNQTNPGPKQATFPDQNVTDKGYVRSQVVFWQSVKSKC